MPVRQRGKKSWQIEVTHQGKRHRRTVRGDRDEALVAHAELKAEVLTGKINEASTEPLVERGMRLRDLPDACANLWMGQAGEQRNLEELIRIVELIGGDILVRDLCGDHADTLVQHWRAAGNKPGTINRKASVINAAAKHIHATRRREMPHLFKLPIARDRASARERWLTEEDEHALNEAWVEMGKDYMVPLVAFLIDTGCRRGEALGIRWQDWHGDHIVLPARITKSGKPRKIPLSRRARKVLEDLKAKGGSGPWTDRQPAMVSRDFKAAKDRIGDTDPDLVLHTTRHTFCSRLVMRGASLLAVRDLAGHSDISMTERYAHLAPATHYEAIGLLNM